MSSFTKIFFLNRLRSLQWLCSDTDEGYPKALLFVPGQDGRNNMGSMNVLKYLFKGSVGKDLFDDTLESELEALEDMVFLIKETSVSIVYSENMKKLINPLTSCIPRLVEYTYSSDEESDIDKFQMRKCINFKKMILEALKPGDGVGVPVPVAYDDILEVEGWPMLQAFALDSIYTATGFFTARHNVADMTTHLETLFRSVDSFIVDSALSLITTAIVPHMNQLLTAMDAPTASQRDRITADDAIGPIDVLYEFGELDAIAPLEKMNRPIMLFGSMTSFIGNVAGPKTAKWRDQLMGDSLHAVLEASEPSSGLRWCRTYFLRHGTEDKLVSEVQFLHDALSGIPVVAEEEKKSEDDDIYLSDEEKSEPTPQVYNFNLKPHNASEIQSTITILSRMQQLYAKLWFHLRRIVHETFLHHHDVLEAGTEIQQRLIDIFSGNYAAYDHRVEEKDDIDSLHQSIQLLPHEKLQIHMDCMNSIGEVITVDDVDDLGGACWTYIRASVHGIKLSNRTEDVGAVAVGDTFLFIPLATIVNKRLKSNNLTCALHSVAPYLADNCCVTQSIPYYQSFIGVGAEEDYARLVNYCSKHTATLSPLSVGRPLDYSGSATAIASILTDHPVLPKFVAELRIFSGGFIVEKMNGQICVPLVISFAHHVEKVYTLDFHDCFTQMKEKILLPYLKTNNEDAPFLSQLLEEVSNNVPDGYIIVYKLKSTSGVTALDRFCPAFHHNSSGLGKYLGVCVRYNDGVTGSSNNITSSVTEHWRAAMRLYDVEDCKGKDAVLPTSVLKSFNVLLDEWLAPKMDDSMYYQSMGKLSTRSSDDEPLSFQNITSYAFDYQVRYGLPGFGVTSLRSMHAISESQRLSAFDFKSLLFADEDAEGITSSETTSSNEVTTMVVAGLAGSGVEIVGSQIYQQIQNALVTRINSNGNKEYVTDLVKLDFTHLVDITKDLKTNQSKINSFVEGKLKFGMRSAPSKRLILVVLCVISTQVHQDFHDLVTLLGSVTSSRVMNVTVVASPDQLLSKRDKSPNKEVDSCLGIEFSSAIGLEMLTSSCCDTVVAIDSTLSTSTYPKFRKYLNAVNPTASLIRLNPTNLNLMEEDVQQYYVKRLTELPISQYELLDREAAAASIGYPTPPLQRMIGNDPKSLEYSISMYTASPEALASIQVIKVTPESVGIPQWALSSLIEMLSFLFPSAKTGTNAVSHFWSISSTSSKQGFHRLLQIASAKVLSDKHHKTIDQQYKAWVNSINRQHNETIECLRAGLNSIHGVLFLENESLSTSTTQMDNNSTFNKKNTCIIIEANKGFIAIREKLDFSNIDNSPSNSYLVINGSLNKTSLTVMQRLLKACEKFPLARKKLLLPEETNKYEKIRIQGLRKFKSRDLPQGWWFDGHFFLDHRGSHQELRPDIDEIVNEYIEAENKKVNDYNSLLTELGY